MDHDEQHDGRMSLENEALKYNKYSLYHCILHQYYSYTNNKNSSNISNQKLLFDILVNLLLSRHNLGKNVLFKALKFKFSCDFHFHISIYLSSAIY